MKTTEVVFKEPLETSFHERFSRDDFPQSVEVVPSGVGENVRKQAEGYAYLRL
jgi:intracellular sulfur oxidation DsrE/DsrF family protein